MGQAETTSIDCPENLILLEETAFGESGNESHHRWDPREKIGMRGQVMAQGDSLVKRTGNTHIR
jgi:hypothetical protein